MRDLIERAEEAVDVARRAGALAVEAYVIDAPTDAVSYEPADPAARPPRGLRLRTALTTPHRGLGLTALWERGVGFASTTDLSGDGLAEAVEACRRWAAPGDPGLPLTPPATASRPADTGLADKRLLEMNLPDLVAVAREVAEQALEAGVGLPGAACLARCRRIAVANSLGLVRSSVDTLVSAAVYAVTARGGFAAWSRTARSLAGLRAMAAGRKAADLAKQAEEPRDVVPGRQTVVLRPDAALSLLASSLGPALGADRVAEGLSPFAGVGAAGPKTTAEPGRAGTASEGPLVAARILSITDDATRPAGTGSYEFDAEGTSGQVTPVIRDGRLVSLLHNNRTAAGTRAAGLAAPAGAVGGLASTGNASRDRSDRMTTFVEPSGQFGYRPGVMPSNLVVEAPGATYAGLSEAGVDKGLLVLDVMGAFVIDPAVGDFSVTTTNAWALEGGRLAYPVKRAMLTGNVYTLLEQVVALAGEPEDVAGPFSVFTPAWIVADVAVV